MKLAAVLVLGAVALAGAETKEQKGKRIVDEAIKALGGDAFLNHKDRTEVGRAYSFYRENLTGLAKARIFTRYLTPNADKDKLSVRERQTFGKDEDVVVLFMEDQGYTLTFRGAKPMEKDRWTRYVESTPKNFFYMMHQRRNEPGLIYEFMGTERIDNVPLEAVNITDADNNVVTVYFHYSTKLPYRQKYIRRDPETKDRIEEVTIFSKYRDSGNGVQWPWHILRERNGEKVFEIYSESVLIDQGLTDDLFTLPGNMKILTPKK